MMILDTCVACDLSSNPIDFGIKGQGQTWKPWGYFSNLGQVSLFLPDPIMLYGNKICLK